MDFELTDEQRLVRETARAFTDNEIVERARENDRNEHFDLELVEKIAAQGYLGAIVPREYGGAGLDYLTYGLIVEEIGRGDSAMRTVVSVQTSLVCSALVRWGTEEQKQHYLPEAVLGRVARLLRPDRARHGIGRRQPAHPGQEDRLGLGDQRRQDVHLDGQLRAACARVRADRPRSGSPRARLLPGRHRPAGLPAVADPPQARAARVRHRGDLAERRRGSRRRDARRDRRRLQGRDELARLRALQRRRRLRRDLPGLPRRLDSLLQGAPAVRPPDRELPARPGDDRRHGARDRRRADARVARGLPEGHGPARTRPRPRSRSCTPPRPRSSAPTPRFRSTAARATSTTTPSSGTSATRA